MDLTTLLPYLIGLLISVIIFVVIFLIFHFLMGKKHPVWALIITLIIIVLLNILFLPKELKDFSINGLKEINKEKNKEKNGKEVEPPVTEETKVTVCNLEELNGFTEKTFLENIWDKTIDGYKGNGEQELKRLEEIYNKCKEDKGKNEDGFYTAVINYKGGLTKAWFLLGVEKGNDKYYDNAINSLITANVDTGGKDDNAATSKRKTEILKIRYDELIIPALDNILKNLEAADISDVDTESLRRYYIAIDTVAKAQQNSLIIDTSIFDYIKYPLIKKTT